MSGTVSCMIKYQVYRRRGRVASSIECTSTRTVLFTGHVYAKRWRGSSTREAWGVFSVGLGSSYGRLPIVVIAELLVNDRKSPQLMKDGCISLKCLGTSQMTAELGPLHQALAPCYHRKTTPNLQRRLEGRSAQREPHKRCVYSSRRGALQKKQGSITYIFPSS